MKGIKNIIFDLGGVVMNIDIQRTVSAFIKMGVTDFSDYFAHGFAASFFLDYEKGLISNEQFLGALKEITHFRFAEDFLIGAWNALLLDFPRERIELLETLGKQYRLFLLSNTNAIHYVAFQKIFSENFDQRRLDDQFEKTYYSHLIGARKPDRESYEKLVIENRLKPRETLFVDDAQINTEGALAMGLSAIWLSPGKEIKDIPW
jgi:HAD superfamily hydrolase (TIGR01509 family)